MVRGKIKVIAILAVIYLFYTDGSSFGFSTDSAWWTHFTYPFFPWELDPPDRELLCFLVCIAIGYSNNTLCQSLYPWPWRPLFLSEMQTPTVGFSGVIFAMGGINSAYRKCKLKNIIPILIALSIGFYFQKRMG